VNGSTVVPPRRGLVVHEGGDPDSRATEPPRLRDQLLSVTQLATLPPADPLVDGLLYKGTVAQLSGPPGSYKSFLTLGMAVSVAVNESFEGHQVHGGRPVVYIASEGASGLRARILARCELSKIDPGRLDDRFFVLPEPVRLDHRYHVDELVEAVAELDAGLVVLDTRARCTGELDENSATEQGKAIAAVEMAGRHRLHRPRGTPLSPRRHRRTRVERMGRRRLE
jgi:hypothetical protein